MPSDPKDNDTVTQPESQRSKPDVDESKNENEINDENNEQENKPAEANETEEESDEEEEEESDEEDPLYAQLASKYNLKVDEKLKEIEEEDEKEEARVDTASSRLVDLRKMNQRYNPKQNSALQHILVEYGLPDPDADKYEHYKRAKKKSKKKKQTETDIDWDDDEKRRSKPEYFDSIFHDKDKLPDYLQDDFVERMEQKIVDQRKAIQKRSEELEKKLEERQKKHLASMRFQRKPQRHDLVHDADFLKGIPKSNAYKNIKYEEKLKRNGKLKTKSELENFWECTNDPIAMKNYLNLMGIAGTNSSRMSSQQQLSQLEDSFISSRTSSLSSITQEKERTVTDFRPLTQIEEMKEPSRPSTRDANATTPWAVTQAFPAKQGLLPKSSGKRSTSPLKPILSVPPSPLKKPQDPYTIAKQAAVELDKKHPMKELPPMYCFNMEVGEKPPDPGEVMKQMQVERREKERRLFVKRIRKMYHLAQANTAATQRIMDKRDDFQIQDEAAPTDTWLSSFDFRERDTESLTEEQKFLRSHPWLQHIRHRAIVTIAEESEPSSGFNSQKTSASLVRQRTAEGGMISKLSNVRSREGQRPLPLTIDALEQNSTKLEAKCLSSYWTNYLGVGKSVFAK